MRARSIALVLTLATAVACGGEEVDTTVQRGVPPAASSGPATPPVPAAPAPTPMAPRRGPPRDEPARPSPSSQGWLVGPVEEQRTETTTTPGTAAERDLGAELQRALGVPQACFPPDVVAAAGSEIRVPVSVVVTAEGRVTRADAGGTAPTAVRECVRRVAEGVSFAAPVEGAPRSVASEIVIDVRRSEPTPPTPRSARSLPPGAQAPGITLPAVGAQGRPDGFVAPGSTLPAQGAEGRPEGFVPPDRTLPARVD